MCDILMIFMQNGYPNEKAEKCIRKNLIKKN